MSARQEAQDAAWNKDSVYDEPGLQGMIRAAVNEASDVWERHYRDLWHAYAGLADHIPMPSFMATRKMVEEVLDGEA